jgi:hypothetical protein
MDTNLIGIAGVHHVVSELSRRGVIALPTVKNTAAYDIIAVNVAGTSHANIQVKTSSKRVPAFPMPEPEKIRTGKNDYYVLLRWVEKEQRYEVFLLKGAEAHKEVAASCNSQKRSVQAGTRKVISPCIRVSGAQGLKAKRWSDAWQKWLQPHP